MNITFFANDSLGMERNSSIVIIKDTTYPQLNILEPLANEVFGTIPPNFTVEIAELYLYGARYQLNNGINWSSFFYFSNNGTINATAWANMSVDGVITINFSAIDTAGNMNSTVITVRKDLYAPNITIISPEPNQLVGRNPPAFTVEFADISLHTKWYSIYDGSQWTDNKTFTDNGTLDAALWESVWDSLQHGDVITIRFYANDSLGRENYAEVQVKKNVTTPPEGPDIMIFIIIGVVIVGAVVGVIVILKKTGGYKSSRKEADKIKDIINTI